MSNRYTEPSIHASYQVSIHSRGFRGEDFLEIDQSETRIAYKNGHHRQFLFLIDRFLKNPLL
jgi:hypothetical protein